jgi:hypothetical protein
MGSSLRADFVESHRGSGLIPTRHKINRSESQHTPTVGSGSTPPLVCSSQANPSKPIAAPSSSNASPRSSLTRAAPLGPCGGLRPSFSPMESWKRVNRRTMSSRWGYTRMRKRVSGSLRSSSSSERVRRSGSRLSRSASSVSWASARAFW